MSKKYKFEFCGKKDDLIYNINTMFSCSYGQYYYKDYIIDIVDGEIRFGVERGGHSGGYWYIPTITECGGKTELCGKICYIGPEGDRSKIRKVIDNIDLALFFILILPILLIVALYGLLELIIRKIFKHPKIKTTEKTTEDKLFDLMEIHLGCVRK